MVLAHIYQVGTRIGLSRLNPPANDPWCGHVFADLEPQAHFGELIRHSEPPAGVSLDAVQTVLDGVRVNMQLGAAFATEPSLASHALNVSTAIPTTRFAPCRCGRSGRNRLRSHRGVLATNRQPLGRPADGAAAGQGRCRAQPLAPLRAVTPRVERQQVPIAVIGAQQRQFASVVPRQRGVLRRRVSRLPHLGWTR